MENAPAIEKARREHATRESRLIDAIRPKIEAHLAAMAMVLDSLAADHQRIADQFDFDLDGETRYAAVWQLAGRSIGIGRGVVALLRQACCVEAMILARGLHECTRLLDAVADPADGDELLLRWLADKDSKYVRPKDARAAEGRADDRHKREMVAAGHPPIGTTADLSGVLYDQLSRIGHNRRCAVADAVDGERRTMIRGPDTGTVEWAMNVATGSQLIEETLLSVGGGLSRFLGPRYLRERLIPLQTSIRAMRSDAPLA